MLIGTAQRFQRVFEKYWVISGDSRFAERGTELSLGARALDARVLVLDGWVRVLMRVLMRVLVRVRVRVLVRVLDAGRAWARGDG